MVGRQKKNDGKTDVVGNLVSRCPATLPALMMTALDDDQCMCLLH